MSTKLKTAFWIILLTPLSIIGQNKAVKFQCPVKYNPTFGVGTTKVDKNAFEDFIIGLCRKGGVEYNFDLIPSNDLRYFKAIKEGNGFAIYYNPNDGYAFMQSNPLDIAGLYALIHAIVHSNRNHEANALQTANMELEADQSAGKAVALIVNDRIKSRAMSEAERNKVWQSIENAINRSEVVPTKGEKIAAVKKGYESGGGYIPPIEPIVSEKPRPNVLPQESPNDKIRQQQEIEDIAKRVQEEKDRKERERIAKEKAEQEEKERKERERIASEQAAIDKKERERKANRQPWSHFELGFSGGYSHPMGSFGSNALYDIFDNTLQTAGFAKDSWWGEVNLDYNISPVFGLGADMSYWDNPFSGNALKGNIKSYLNQNKVDYQTVNVSFDGFKLFVPSAHLSLSSPLNQNHYFGIRGQIGMGYMHNLSDGIAKGEIKPINSNLSSKNFNIDYPNLIGKIVFGLKIEALSKIGDFCSFGIHVKYNDSFRSSSTFQQDFSLNNGTNSFHLQSLRLQELFFGASLRFFLGK